MNERIMIVNYIDKIDVLIEVLPYVERFRGHIIIIKYGGNAMINHELKHAVMQDVLMMKSVGMIPIVVHGGGPFISQMLDKLSMESEFINGLRVTSQDTMAVAEMVLSGSVNNDIVRTYTALGGKAIGLSGLDSQLIQVSKKEMNYGEYSDLSTSWKPDIDLGFVGNIETVNTDLLYQLIELDYIPIISSIGIGPDGQSYNINADEVASAIATAMKANKLIYLTNTTGILANSQDPDSLISELTIGEALQLMDDKVITEGMIPKVNCCIDAICHGVENARIIDGRVKHSILYELFFDMGIGTMITNDE